MAKGIWVLLRKTWMAGFENPPGANRSHSHLQHNWLHGFDLDQELIHGQYNPTIQRYYRFTATPLTPIAALHKRPLSSSSNTPMGNTTASAAGVTGLLRRSAVVPSHGLDTTGKWILVSVGGRSGWARRKTSNNNNNHPGEIITAGFAPVDEFVAKDAWVG